MHLFFSEDKEKVEKVLIEHIESSPLKIQKGSQLASQLRYNLYTAEEPIQINGIQQSFGEHRCSAIADAIQDYYRCSLPIVTETKIDCESDRC